MAIDITGLNKAEVVAALYNNASQASAFLIGDTPSSQDDKIYDAEHTMAPDEAQLYLNDGSYFGLLKGRPMKISLVGTELKPLLYDQYNGEGAAENALKELLATQE